MARPLRPTGPPKPRVPMLLMPVWDLPSRLFLWLTAATLALHALLPSARTSTSAILLALVVFRVAWGFVGSETARFRNAFGGAAPVGHTLATGAALVAWLVLLATLALTGLRPGWDALHAAILYAAGAGALAHSAARLALQRQDLAPELLRGRRRLPANLRQPRFASPALGAAIMAGAAVLVFLWVRFV